MAGNILLRNALADQCTAFGITHDYALGLVSWLHGLDWQVKGRGGSIHYEAQGLSD